ncbi:uncharacterized protein BX663DRAFT_557637 [Cokeromyces recurvatus]|uniref:uncharacterized protein n=1 Tax=Cokeromyces recurvatus TaxID=90255 RepID=UPI00221F2A12|nr:uncharacterized protein BX663DRAFT_557637 [Cokeromyces recurvatus]KAI7907020.1 hypothetical protein BX663DRAFT_557637 [Cokeromyces recurvatus]
MLLNTFSKEIFQRFLTATNRAQITQYSSLWRSQRFISTHNVSSNITPHVFNKALLSYSPSKEPVSMSKVSEHVSRLLPFSAPAPPSPMINRTSSTTKAVEKLELTSVLRKRRLKMNKHKHKKLRKRTRALRKKLGK